MLKPGGFQLKGQIPDTAFSNIGANGFEILPAAAARIGADDSGHAPFSQGQIAFGAYSR